MKLTRATIPMCPQCKVALDWEWDDDAKDQGDGRCPKCRAPWFLHGFNHPDWGYHAPDIEGVVREGDASSQVLEDIKVALRRPGTDRSYVEWAKECRDSMDRKPSGDAREVAAELRLVLENDTQYQNGAGNWCVSVRPEHIERLAARVESLASQPAPSEVWVCMRDKLAVSRVQTMAPKYGNNGTFFWHKLPVHGTTTQDIAPERALITALEQDLTLAKKVAARYLRACRRIHLEWRNQAHVSRACLFGDCVPIEQLDAALAEAGRLRDKTRALQAIVLELLRCAARSAQGELDRYASEFRRFW